VARSDLTTGIQQSVLDRLIGGNESTHWEASLEQLKSALRRDPVPEEVAFDTVLRIVTGEIEVRGDADEK
jgi:hypothetical protein